ncbi:uncharacterized protein LOC127104391 [Lathyrus oleraceus]|uniref:uncharacterized protein LOC127104391 n=1 Tax=Pisum sativum TaxID=3888 RepID=UPI0021CF3319|nr:uncharacterized protein LOC127104391 [Pisum sativum]
MDIGRRNTRKYSFRCPDLKELRKLASFVDDPMDFRLYDSDYRCFTFPDYHLFPTMEEYAYLLGIPVSDSVPFCGLEGIMESQVISGVIHLKKFDVDVNLTVKGGMKGLTSNFLIERASSFANVGSMVDFETILSLLIYGLVLFPNIDSFFDVNAIRIFLVGNLLPQSPIFKKNKGCLWWSQILVSLTNDDITWYSYVYDDVEIIDSCGELSNVRLLGTQGGINHNPALARHQLGFAMKDKPKNTLLEGLFFQEGENTQGLKARMVHAWHNIHRKGKVSLNLRIV